MKEFFEAIFLTMFLLMASGCATVGNGQVDATEEITIQYATLKLIEESDDIDAATVREHVDRVRAIVETDSTLELARLVAEARGPIDFDALAPSDRLLLNALFERIESAAGDTAPDDREVSLLRLLDTVEEAAGFYGN